MKKRVVPCVQQLFAWLQPRQTQMVKLLRRLVEIESPTTNKKAVDRLGELLAEELRNLGGKVRLHPQRDVGSHIQADFDGAGRNNEEPVLLLGHHDTVWEMGTLADMPCRESQGRVWGPGALDMKSGLTQILFALRALRASYDGWPRPVRVLIVSDEETGSERSRELIEKLAHGCAAVFVMEPALGLDGALKTERKGVGEYTVKVHGQPSHAGVDFTAGASAISELARQISIMEMFTDMKHGITVNPGVIRGGTRTNVVAAEAEVELDVRIRRQRDAAKLARWFHQLRPFDRRCKLEVSGGINRPPMERSRGIAQLFAQAQVLAREIGAAEGRAWKLQEAATGGASDGNFTAALRIATLDGLGGVGEGPHARNESVLISEMPRRAALLAALLATSQTA